MTSKVIIKRMIIAGYSNEDITLRLRVSNELVQAIRNLHNMEEHTKMIMSSDKE